MAPKPNKLHFTTKENNMKYLPVVLALLVSMPVSASFAACDNCGLVGGGYQGAPGPILGGIPALLGLGGLWAYRRFKKKQNS
jgi:LPXTG-motif cell wall-anchored protein